MILSTISSNFTNVTPALASTNTLKNVKTLRDADLFSSVISSISSTQSDLADKDMSLAYENKNTILNTSFNLVTLNEPPKFVNYNRPKCHKCFTKQKYRPTKSASDIYKNINDFIEKFVD